MPVERIGLLVVCAMFLAACEGPAGDSEATEARVQASPFPHGAALYERQCRACHQSDGSGLGNHFPPLAGHAADLVQAEGGREYFIELVLYGLGGQIEIQGRTYSGVMPGFRRLSDEDVAAIINHSVHAWGGQESLPDDFQAIQPEEVADRRADRLNPNQVRERRPTME